MTIHIGYIPYLNMVPFHQGFGPQPLELAGTPAVFHSCSPHALGIEAERGRIDAGAMSLVDWFRLSDHFEPVGKFGIGVKKAAQSVLFFSREPLSKFRGVCAVTDATSTSFRLLQALIERRYAVTDVTYGRVASGLLYDGSADGLLLIGDEALEARSKGIKTLPIVTDLAEEWYEWQGVPFVFARWVVRKNLPKKVKDELYRYLENSLGLMSIRISKRSRVEALGRAMDARALEAYWDGFAFRLSESHLKSISLFEDLIQKPCLTV